MAERKPVVGIIGMGLIGGSLAKALRKNTAGKARVLGADLDPKTMAKARVADVIEGDLTPDAYKDCDYLLIALYPSAVLSFLEENAGLFNPRGVVIDCAGIKREICALGGALADRYGFTFIGGHPMAGREVWGFSAATNTLFNGASMILCPRGDIDIRILAHVKNFFLSIGFGRITVRTPADHDRIIAYTSQLAHVLSSAYIGSATAEEHRGLSAGSFKDMTRVATINGEMWSEIFLANREPLLSEIDGLIDRLSAFRAGIAENDRDLLRQLMKDGNDRKKECFKKIEEES